MRIEIHSSVGCQQSGKQIAKVPNQKRLSPCLKICFCWFQSFLSFQALFLYLMKKASQEDPQTQYDIIKKYGYQLADPLQFSLPTATNHTSIIKNLFKIFIDDSYQKSIFKPQSPKRCTVIDEKIIALSHSNKLTVLYYTIVEDKLSVDSKACYLLNEPIKRVVAAYYETKVDKNQNYEYFAVQYESSQTITLFKVDQHFNITLSNEIKARDQIIAMRFVGAAEIMVLLKDCRISHYLIADGKLKHSKFNLKILMEDDQVLKYAEICNSRIENQSKVLLFYQVYSKKHQKYQLHLKEFFKDLNNKLQEQATFYDVFEYSNEYLTNELVISSFKEGLLIHQNLTVFVLQKKFGKYFKSDVISQLNNAKKIILMEKNDHMFLCSMGDNQIELWEVKLKDVGCALQLLDVVETSKMPLAGKTINAWIFLHSKRPEFALMTDGGTRKVEFYLTKKMDKLSKLMTRVKRQEVKFQSGNLDFNQKNIFVSKLKQIEELGGKLGFNRRQFYLKLWHQSEKNSTHIIEFLLSCKDFKIIFNEITLYLRVKKLAVTEIIRILKKIEKSILQELTIKLDLQLLRQLLKTNFQRRKLKLYNGDMHLDFEQYQNIYQSSVFDLIQRSIDLCLFPEKFKHDIVWKEQIVEKPIYIPYILKEFRLLILEDYPNFLLKLLKPYNDHLRDVIDTYPYLLPQFPLKISIIREELVMLSNIYQEEKIEEQQYSWLGYIRQNQWERQSSSIDFLFNHLFKHHATSLINDKLRQFFEGNWCVKNKYLRHTLLLSKKKEFEDKLPAISDGSSLLFLCQKANRVALECNRITQSEQIVEIMHNHNHLPLAQYYRYRLFCTLHFILISQRIVHENVTILQLMQLSKEKLVAFFFLGDRERIDLLFKVVAKHYPSKSAFYSIIETFITSEQCSKVELEMLTMYLTKQGDNYQQNNQQLVGIVIKGYLSRIEIRQKDKYEDFLVFFRGITLSQDFLITMAIFESIITECLNILKMFDLSHFTFEAIIYDPSRVINSIIHSFFSHTKIRNKSLYIEGREVNLSFPQNLFVIILYLKDKIYSFNEEMQIYLIFCEGILAWNQFQLLKACFNEEIVIDEKEYFSQEFYGIVVDFMLGKYYEDEKLIYNDETKDHIFNLLSLIDPSSEIYVIQTAKLQFVNCLQPLQQSISVQYMQIIKEQWEKGDDRKSLFHDIIDLFRQEINFEVIMKLYECLEKISTGGTYTTLKTQEFIEFSLYICRKHMKCGQFQQINEIIYFLNNGEKYYKAKYSIMTQCFLQVINAKVQSPHQIRQSFVKVNKLAELNSCKQLINFYLQNYDKPEAINSFYAARFEQSEREFLDSDEIQVDHTLCFSQFDQVISRKHIWQIIVKITINNSTAFTKASVINKSKPMRQPNPSNNALDSKTILFTYYFICNFLKDKKYLFEMQQISFNHHENIATIEEISRGEGIQQRINFKKIYLEYLKGLFKVYYLEFENSQGPESKQNDLPVFEKETVSIQQKIKEIKNMGDSKLILLISDLPLDKGNVQTIRVMKKLIPLYQAAFVFPEEKPQKLNTMKTVVEEEHSLPLYFEDKHQKDIKESVTQLAIPHHDQTMQMKTFKFLEFEQIKKQIASKSNIVSGKMIIEKVLDELENNNLSRSIVGSEIFLEDRFIINRVLVEQRQAGDDLQIGNVLIDLNSQQTSSLIAADLLEMKNAQYDRAKLEEIKSLIEGKEFQRLVSYDVRMILKVIEQEYYRADQVLPPKPKKRIVRSNTIKESILSSKIISLLETLDNLKLYSNTSKARILRSCLMVVSSEELLSIETFLLSVFKLDILLGMGKNIPQLVKLILENVRDCKLALELDKYHIVVKIVDNFIRKCKQEAQYHHPFKSSPRIVESHETAELYYEFVRKSSQSTKTYEERVQELSAIMHILGKEQLLVIHQKVLATLLQGELYVSYLELIHNIYLINK